MSSLQTRNLFQLLNSFNCTINLGKSFIFLRVVLLIYSLATFMVVWSAWAIWLKLLCVLALVGMSLATCYKPTPYPHYSKLVYQHKKWFLYEAKDNYSQCFEGLRLVLNIGLFFMLELKSEGKTQILLIFHDQIPPDMYRNLRIHEKFLIKNEKV
jgi:hypothetical protein